MSETITPVLVSDAETTNLGKLYGALAKAQGEFPAIVKNRQVEVYGKDNPSRLLYSFKYADLTEIISAVRPPLSKHGLSFTQNLEMVPELGECFVTTLFHESGARLRTGIIPVILKAADMKAIAGACTYGKRLSLSAAMGVAAEEDVDAPPEAGESLKAKDAGRALAPRQNVNPPRPKAGPDNTARSAGSVQKQAAPDASKGSPVSQVRDETPISGADWKKILEIGKQHLHSEKNVLEYAKGLYLAKKSSDVKMYQANELVEFLRSLPQDEINVIIQERSAERAGGA